MNVEAHSAPCRMTNPILLLIGSPGFHLFSSSLFPEERGAFLLAGGLLVERWYAGRSVLRVLVLSIRIEGRALPRPR